MTCNPFRLTAVFFHLEGTLAALNDRGLQAAVKGPAVRTAFAMLRDWELGIGVISRHSHDAVRRFLKMEFRVRPADLRNLVYIEDLRARGGQRNFLQAAAKTMGSVPERFLVVSADPDVLRLAQEAGAVAVEWGDGPPPDPALRPPDVRVAGFEPLQRIIRMGIPLPPGKLPNELLEEVLAELTFEDPSLLINPGVGQDVAAMDVSVDEVLVLKSDPITFATDAIGRYAVLVNANDIATAGAAPRWLLTTLLFPVGSTPSFIWSVIRELQDFCRKWGITLCGGHTEITDAVSRPVVCGMMAGSVRKRDLIDKRRMRPGDRVLMTKAAAVEGTALIARELAPRLRALGLSQGEIRSSRAFLDRISILPEARRAARCPGTSAMHDVTEGGIATALEELSAAGGFRLRVHLDRIPVLPETRRICGLLGVHPLGLIGSGSLLICCRPKYSQRLERDLNHVGVQVTWIGEVAEKGFGVQGFRCGRPARWPRFKVDEIARLFAGGRGAFVRNGPKRSAPCVDRRT
ncbi:MAG: AIR synthase related protein [Hyphomicrobiales bacterium]